MRAWYVWLPVVLFYGLVGRLGLVDATLLSAVASLAALLWQRHLKTQIPWHDWTASLGPLAVGLISLAIHSEVPIASLNLVLALATGLAMVFGTLLSKHSVQRGVAAQVTADPAQRDTLAAALRIPLLSVGGLWAATAGWFLLQVPHGQLLRLRLVSDAMFAAEVGLLYFWVRSTIRRTLPTQQPKAGRPRSAADAPSRYLIGLYMLLRENGRGDEDAAQRVLLELRRRTAEPEVAAFLRKLEGGA